MRRNHTSSPLLDDPRRLVSLSSRVGLLSVVLLLGACATVTRPVAAARLASNDAIGDGASPEGSSLTPSQKQQLWDLAGQAILDMKSPGLVIGVQIGNGEPYVFGKGARTDRGGGMQGTERFRVGSITKNFVGMAILQQMQEGRLSVDDTLERWLPKVFSNIDGNRITLRQLLNHTSGIESYTEAEFWISNVYLHPTHTWQAPGDLLALVEMLRAESIAGNTVIPPGSRFSYSNTNFILLGMIAAKVDGYGDYAWERVIQNRFFNRLGMSGSHIPGPHDVELGPAEGNHGYVNFYNFLKDAQGGSSCPYLNPGCENEDMDFTQQDMSNAWSAGEIISTARDLVTWINAEVKGELLSPPYRELQQSFMDTCPASSPHCPTQCVQVGLGMFRQTTYGFIGHRGEIFGFNGTIQYLPQLDLTVVVLSNRTALDGYHVGLIPEAVAKTLFPGLVQTGCFNQGTDLARDNISHLPLPARYRR
ncbi:MAG: serine hydrolase domain-containing protein [Cystobacter sp.]